MQLKDVILLVRVNDQKLIRFLEKVGYEVVIAADTAIARDILDRQPVDAILYDGIEDVDAANVVEFFRTQKKLSSVPFFFFADDNLQLREVNVKRLAKVEVFEKPYTIGVIASKIATELRLRKFAGADNATASIAEVNAALRDLTGRLKKDLEDARTLQQSLLPQRLPQDSRFQIAASYEPLEEVGGDWLYVTKHPDEKIAVQIADVTGHGLSAAFIGSMTKLALMAAAETEPDKLLSRMNELMAPQMPEGKFVTMFSYLYDPASGRVDYSRAGHPPGLLFSKTSGTVKQLMGDGFAVGFFEEATYQALSDQLEVGDILLVYTDALTESQNMKGECYGLDRMEHCLTGLSDSASATDAISALIADFEDFRGGRILKDDVTIIALKRVK